MKVIQIISILVLLAFAPFATAAPIQLWATCEQDSYGGGVAVDLFAVRDEVVEWVQVTFMEPADYYIEEIIPIGYYMVEGELYADVGGTPDITHSVSAEEVRAYRWNPWAIGVCIVGGIVGVVGIALYTKGDSDTDNSITINGNDNTINNNEGDEASSDSHDVAPVAQ